MDELYVDSVQHAFSGRTVINNVYLKCKIGEVVGILGRNGCGKSTLLKIIFGTITPRYKHLKVDDKIVQKGYQSGHIGYLPQSFFIPPYLTLNNAIQLFTSSYRQKILAIDFIKRNIDQKLGKLSGGNRRFIETLLMIYSDAKFVLLDEPFSQLSPFLIEDIKSHIRLMSSFKGFILTDHYYEHIQEISSQIILLHNGCNYAINTADDLIVHGYLPNRKF